MTRREDECMPVCGHASLSAAAILSIVELSKIVEKLVRLVLDSGPSTSRSGPRISAGPGYRYWYATWGLAGQVELCSMNPAHRDVRLNRGARRVTDRAQSG
jgi:hypothetical protein